MSGEEAIHIQSHWAWSILKQLIRSPVCCLLFVEWHSNGNRGRRDMVLFWNFFLEVLGRWETGRTELDSENWWLFPLWPLISPQTAPWLETETNRGRLFTSWRDTIRTGARGLTKKVILRELSINDSYSYSYWNKDITFQKSTFSMSAIDFERNKQVPVSLIYVDDHGGSIRWALQSLEATCHWRHHTLPS